MAMEGTRQVMACFAQVQAGTFKRAGWVGKLSRHMWTRVMPAPKARAVHRCEQALHENLLILLATSAAKSPPVLTMAVLAHRVPTKLCCQCLCFNGECVCHKLLHSGWRASLNLFSIPARPHNYLLDWVLATSQLRLWGTHTGFVALMQIVGSSNKNYLSAPPQWVLNPTFPTSDSAASGGAGAALLRGLSSCHKSSMMAMK